MSGAVNAGFIGLAIIMALNSAISVYYYLKLIVYMFLKDPVTNDGTIYMKNSSIPLKVVMGFAVAATVLATFMTNSLLETITHYVKMSGF
jgi:NADH-quinone oxidoreductase subunit N